MAATLTIEYWNHGKINNDAFVAVFLFLIIGINLFGVKGYGEAEFVVSFEPAMTDLEESLTCHSLRASILETFRSFSDSSRIIKVTAVIGFIILGVVINVGTYILVDPLNGAKTDHRGRSSRRLHWREILERSWCLQQRLVSVNGL